MESQLAGIDGQADTVSDEALGMDILTDSC